MKPSTAPPTTSTIGYGIRQAPGERAQAGHGDQQPGDQELGLAHAPYHRADRTRQADSARRRDGVPRPERVDGEPAARRLARLAGAGRGEPAVDGRLRGRDRLSLIFFSWGLYQLLKLAMSAYQEATGTTPTVRTHAPWLRSMRGERPGLRQRRARISGAERIVVRDRPDRRRRVRDLVLLLLAARRSAAAAGADLTLCRLAPAPVAQLDRAAAF